MYEISMTDPAEDPWDEMYNNQPCQGCGESGPCKDDCPEIAYNEYLEERISRLGFELAMLPDFMECYPCGREHLMVMTDNCGMKYVLRRPVGLGPIAEARRDPTQTYRLECGHTVM